MDDHYIEIIGSLGDRRKLVTTQAIYAGNGIKLVNKGVRFNSRFIHRLVQHKLIPVLEECLEVDGGINVESLAEEVNELMLTSQTPCWKAIQSEPGISSVIGDSIRAITLNAPLAFKLTLASEQRKDVFEHSLQVTLLALYLAIKADFSKELLKTIATAALFHDIGLLHIAPSIMEPGKKLAIDERHHLYSHPITGYLILKSYPEYHPQVSTPVYEHHERMDGSGYPRGLVGDEISLVAQVLMLAEIAGSFIFKSEGQRVHHLAIALKLNQHKVSRQLSDHLLNLAQRIAESSPKECVSKSPAELELSRKKLADVFQDWRDTYKATCVLPLSPRQLKILELANDRFAQLYRNVLDAGIPTYQQNPSLDNYKDDPAIMDEIAFSVDEVIWQFSDVARDVQRHATELEKEGNQLPKNIHEWLSRVDEML